MKPTPSQRAHCIDFGGIFDLPNGFRMREKARSEVFLQQTKKGAFAGQVVVSQHDTWQGQHTTIKVKLSSAGQLSSCGLNP